MPARCVAELNLIAEAFPEIQGRLTHETHRAFQIKSGRPAWFQIEAHLHSTPLPVEDEFELAALGFQPDFFLCCLPPEYTACWTLRLKGKRPSNRGRSADLLRFVRQQLSSAQ